MTVALEQLPLWLSRAAWSAATIAGAYLIAVLIKVFVTVRLERIAAKSHGDWDDILVAELRRRVPFWGVLVGVYLSLGHWTPSAEAYHFATRVLAALGVLSVTLATAAVATRLVSVYGPRLSPTTPVSGLTKNVVRILVMVLGILVVIRSLGYDITPMLAALGVGGIAVALALQEPLASLFAGVFISVAGQVRIGDYVKLDTGAEGVVADFNWRSATLRQLADNVIVVPNSKLAQAVVTNFNLPTPEMGIGVDVVVARASDLALVERIAREVAAEVVGTVEGAVKTSPPSVRFQEFTDRGIRVSIGMRARTFTDQFLIRHECIKRLGDRLTREGVRIV